MCCENEEVQGEIQFLSLFVRTRSHARWRVLSVKSAEYQKGLVNGVWNGNLSIVQRAVWNVPEMEKVLWGVHSSKLLWRKICTYCIENTTHFNLQWPDQLLSWKERCSRAVEIQILHQPLTWIEMWRCISETEQCKSGCSWKKICCENEEVPGEIHFLSVFVRSRSLARWRVLSVKLA